MSTTASYTILAFAAAKDILGNSKTQIELPSPATTDSLLKALKAQYPEMVRLNSLRVAVNGEFAEVNQPLTATDEIALIPPVSGG